METYPVDLEASQIVRWLIDEQRRGTLQFNVTATRSYVVEAFERADLAQMGEDAADLNDILAFATLEVRPANGKMAGRSASVSRTGSAPGCRKTRMRPMGRRKSISKPSKRIFSSPTPMRPRSLSRLKTRTRKPISLGFSTICFATSIALSADPAMVSAQSIMGEAFGKAAKSRDAPGTPRRSRLSAPRRGTVHGVASC